MRIAVVADLHHYSQTLGISGRAYELRSGNDQKCLKETGAIIDAAFARFVREKPDAVIIAGDLTNDGETISHKEIREKLLKLNQTVPVFVTTATHDWCCDGHARRYEGSEVLAETDVYTPTRLREDYRVFGEDKILDEYRTHLDKCSYCYAVSPELRLLALEDDQDGEGHSGYSEEHLQWIEAQLAKAKEDGAAVIAMQHHLLLENLIPLINGGQKIGNNIAKAERLADAGLRLIFVGHSHMQRTSSHTSDAGNTITQVNVGSLCGYPGPINYLNIDGDTAEITVEKLESFMYDGEEKGTEYLKNQTTGVLVKLLDAAMNDCADLDERLRANGIRVDVLPKIYPIVKFAATKLTTVSVGKAGKAVNALTFGKGIDKKAIAAIANDRLFDYVLAIFLCVFDGSEIAKTLPNAAKTVAANVSTLPGRIIKKLPIKQDKCNKIFKITNQVEDLVQELMYPKCDHQHTIVKLK